MYTHVRRKARLLKRKANIRVNHGEKDELERLARSYITRPVHPFIIVPGDEIEKQPEIAFREPDDQDNGLSSA